MVLAVGWAIGAAIFALTFIGLAYAFGWLYFTSGSLRFANNALPTLSLQFALLFASALLGQELLLRRLMLEHVWHFRLSGVLITGILTGLLHAPLWVSYQLPWGHTIFRVLGVVAWGITLALLYRHTRSLVTTALADAVYRLVLYFVLCNVELPYISVAYYVTSTHSVHYVSWLAAICALVPGGVLFVVQERGGDQ